MKAMDELEKLLAGHLAAIMYNDQDAVVFVPPAAQFAAETIRKMIEHAVRFPLQNT